MSQVKEKTNERKNEGFVEIRTERCKACGLCVAHCPKQAISFLEETNSQGYTVTTIDRDLCIVCGMCYMTCPDGVYQVHAEGGAING